MFSMFQPILGIQCMLKGWRKAAKSTFLMPWLGGYRVPDLQEQLDSGTQTSAAYFCCCSFLLAINKTPTRYDFGWTQQELTSLKARLEPYPLTCNYWTPFMPPMHQLLCTEGAENQYENALVCKWPWLEKGTGSRDKYQCRRWSVHTAGEAQKTNPWLGQHPPFHPAHSAVFANTNIMGVKFRPGRQVKGVEGEKKIKKSASAQCKLILMIIFITINLLTVLIDKVNKHNNHNSLSIQCTNSSYSRLLNNSF